MFNRYFAACSATALAVAAAQPAHAQATYSFNLPAQPLGASLRAIGSQTRTNVIFKPEAVRGKSAPQLRGTFTAQGAVEEVLRSSGLQVNVTAGGSILVGPAAQQGVSSYGDDDGDGEIIVTAQRREQRLRDVPISLSVVTGADIERRGLVSAEDYLRGIPGTNQVDSANGQSIVIRGMETRPQNQNFFSGTTTATYFGETPTTASAGLASGTAVDIKLVDIERVEILRGPQGTAFGNSSMGGAVRTIPVAPKLADPSFRVAAGYSRTARAGGDNYSVQAIANVPVVQDVLAIRAVGYRLRDEGYYRNITATDPAFQAAVVVPNQAQALARNEDHVGTSIVTGGRVSALFQPVEDFRLTLSYLHQKNETDGLGIATKPGYNQAILQVSPANALRGRTGGVADTKIELFNATAEKDFEWATLLATYSHIDSRSAVSQSDQLYGINTPTSSSAEGDHGEDIFEGRIVTRFSGPVNFIAGIYHENVRDTYAFDYRWSAPATNVFGTDFLGSQDDVWRLKQTSFYGEVSWEVLPKLTLTGGIRAFKFSRNIKSDFDGLFLAQPSVDNTTKKSGQSYKANVSYKPTDRALIYASFSQGFRLGKPQAGVSPLQCDPNNDGIIDGTNIPIASTRTVNSDYVDSYELGTKLTSADNRFSVDAAVFRMDWTDIPVTVAAGTRPASCGLGYVTNAGSARSEGVELQFNLQIAASTHLSLGGSYINARLTEDVPAQRFESGDRLPGSPRWTGNAAIEQRFEIGGRQSSVRVDGTYIGPFFGDILESPTLRAGDYIKVDLSGRVSFGDLDVTLFARNLFNEDAFTFRAVRPAIQPDHGYRLRPRTVGVQIAYQF